MTVQDLLRQAAQAPSPRARRVLEEAAERAAVDAAASAARKAREAVHALDEGRLGDALALVVDASLDAHQAILRAWPWWHQRQGAS